MNTRNFDYNQTLEVYNVGKAWFVDLLTDIDDERYDVPDATTIYSSHDEQDCIDHMNAFDGFDENDQPYFDFNRSKTS